MQGITPHARHEINMARRDLTSRILEEYPHANPLCAYFAASERMPLELQLRNGMISQKQFDEKVEVIMRPVVASDARRDFEPQSR